MFLEALIINDDVQFNKLIHLAKKANYDFNQSEQQIGSLLILILTFGRLEQAEKLLVQKDKEGKSLVNVNAICHIGNHSLTALHYAILYMNNDSINKFSAVELLLKNGGMASLKICTTNATGFNDITPENTTIDVNNLLNDLPEKDQNQFKALFVKYYKKHPNAGSGNSPRLFNKQPTNETLIADTNSPFDFSHKPTSWTPNKFLQVFHDLTQKEIRQLREHSKLMNSDFAQETNQQSQPMASPTPTWFKGRLVFDNSPTFKVIRNSNPPAYLYFNKRTLQEQGCPDNIIDILHEKQPKWCATQKDKNKSSGLAPLHGNFNIYVNISNIISGTFKITYEMKCRSTSARIGYFEYPSDGEANYNLLIPVLYMKKGMHTTGDIKSLKESRKTYQVYLPNDQLANDTNVDFETCDSTNNLLMK